MLFKNQNQKFFFYHNILREFFHSIGKLGWAYLLLNGINFIVIIIGLIFYRYLSSHQFLYFSRKYFTKLTYDKQIFISVFVQSLFLLSFYFAKENYYYFGLTIFLCCLSEVFYWPIRNNIQRFCIAKDSMGTNVSLTKNAKTLAILGGYLFLGIGLYLNPLLSLIIGALGMLTSYFPLRKISLNKIKTFDKKFPKTFFSFKNKINLLKKYPEIRNYFYICGIIELISRVIPLLIIFYGASLLELGLILTFFQIFSLGYYYVIGKFEDRNNNHIYNKSVILLGINLLLFSYINYIYLSILLLIFSILGIGIEIGITSKLQKKIGEKFPLADSGYVLVWASNFGRSLALLMIPLIYYLNFPLSFHSLILIYTFFILGLIYFSSKKITSK